MRGIWKAWTASPAEPWKSPGVLLFSAFPSAEEMRPLPQRELVWLLTQFVFCSKAGPTTADLWTTKGRSTNLPPFHHVFDEQSCSSCTAAQMCQRLQSTAEGSGGKLSFIEERAPFDFCWSSVSALPSDGALSYVRKEVSPSRPIFRNVLQVAPFSNVTRLNLVPLILLKFL